MTIEYRFAINKKRKVFKNQLLDFRKSVFLYIILLMNLKEIAQKAGVSIGTVDRVLHNRGRVSQENVEKIMKIAKENGYEPNPLASMLKSQKKYTFGVLIPELGSELGYWIQVYQGIKDAERELKSMQIEIVYAFYNRTLHSSFLSAAEKLFASKIDAYIVAPLIPEEMEKLASLHPDIPYVFIDSDHPSLSPLATLAQSPERAGEVGARMIRLLAPDVERIYTLQTFSSAFNGKMRAYAFTDAIKKIDDNIQIINIAIENYEGFLHHINSIDANSKYGLFVVNDGAAAVCEILKSHNLLKNFTIIGFDLSPENKEKLESGAIAAILGQRPINQAYDAVMLLYKRFVLKLDILKDINSPIDIYLKENIPTTDFWL